MVIPYPHPTLTRTQNSFPTLFCVRAVTDNAGEAFGDRIFNKVYCSILPITVTVTHSLAYVVSLELHIANYGRVAYYNYTAYFERQYKSNNNPHISSNIFIRQSLIINT